MDINKIIIESLMTNNDFKQFVNELVDSKVNQILNNQNEVASKIKAPQHISLAELADLCGLKTKQTILNWGILKSLVRDADTYNARYIYNYSESIDAILNSPKVKTSTKNKLSENIQKYA